VTAGAAGGRRALAGAGGTVVTIMLVFLATCAGSGGDPGGKGAAPSTARSGDPASSGAPGATSAGSSAAGAAVRQHANPFSEAVAGYLAQRSGTVLAAVYDVWTGQSWRLGDGPAQDEASVVKLDILETLLAGSGGAGLASDDQAPAGQMIEDSDNGAATSLWDAAGGAAGVAAYNAKAGLTGTTTSSCVECAGFSWPGWGLSTTVPYDQITLLKKLIEPGPLLTTAERGYALSLLENVAPDQAWGITGGVPAGVTVAVKNGWLPLNDANTDWQINSEGWVSGDGRDYLIAVLTSGNPAEQYGIDTIDELSTLVWTAMY
jgi:hypothetical protein